MMCAYDSGDAAIPPIVMAGLDPAILFEDL